MKTWDFVIPAHMSGERIDLAVMAFDLGLSRRKVRSIIDAGGVYVNRKRMRVASRKVQAGDKLRIEYNEASLQKIKQAVFEITADDLLIHEDGIVGLNKPPGLPSQATRDQAVMHAEPLLRKFLEADGGKRMKPLILVHRLDKETSGVLMFALNGKDATLMTDMFRERTMQKEYWALCAGVPKEDQFEVKNYLAPIDRKTGHVRAVRSGGKTAATKFEVVARHPDYPVSWVRCFPKTGRSHQIRVHLADLGLPILGDKRYGEAPVNVPHELMAFTKEHHFLHAHKLHFQWRGKDKTVVAEPPPNLKAALKWLAFDTDDLL